MSEILALFVAPWLGLLLVVSLVTVLRARAVATRILAGELVVLVLIALLTVYVYATGSAYALDGALVLALLSLVSTTAAARLFVRGRVAA